MRKFCEARKLKTQKKYYVQKIEKNSYLTQNEIKKIKEEAELGRANKHPAISNILEIHETPFSLIFVYDLDFLEPLSICWRKLNRIQVKNLMAVLLRILADFDEIDFCFINLSLESILVRFLPKSDKVEALQLMGAHGVVPRKPSELASYGALGYFPPEFILAQFNYEIKVKKIHAFSAGVIFYEL